MQILIPIASRSVFFPESDYFFPKPLVDVAGKPMIERVVTRLKESFDEAKFIFIVDKMDCLNFSLDRMLMLMGGENTIVIEKNGGTAGALCSALLAVDDLDLSAPLLISNSDTLIHGNLSKQIKELTSKSNSASVFTFESLHPRWSYVQSSSTSDLIEQVFEKEVISTDAIAGLYYFESAGCFVEAAKETVLAGTTLNGDFYISSTINQIILTGGVARYIRLFEDCVHSFYSPKSIELYVEYLQHSKPEQNDTVNIVIPAAGLGSRFAEAGWKKPKPFIDVSGEPMLKRVVENLKVAKAQYIILTREDYIESNKRDIEQLERAGATFLPVPGLTEGTACTVLAAERLINSDDILMVANSDQLVDFDPTDYINDLLTRDLDGSILVFKDQAKNPKWSFAKIKECGLVERVAEKDPISDLATVGIYLFRKGSSFISGAVQMIVANDRVNKEFYTCPVYNYLIDAGLKIGVYEVSPTKMHGLGTPSDLEYYLRSNNSPPSKDAP